VLLVVIFLQCKTQAAQLQFSCHTKITVSKLAWDVTVSYTYADSHIDKTAVRPVAPADKAAQNKIDKYAMLASTRIPVCYRDSRYVA